MREGVVKLYDADTLFLDVASDIGLLGLSPAGTPGARNEMADV